MKSERKHPCAFLQALSFAAELLLGCAGIILLCCEVDETSPLVEGIGWLFALLLTKVGAAALLFAALCLYKVRTGLRWTDIGEGGR